MRRTVIATKEISHCSQCFYYENTMTEIECRHPEVQKFPIGSNYINIGAESKFPNFCPFTKEI